MKRFFFKHPRLTVFLIGAMSMVPFLSALLYLVITVRDPDAPVTVTQQVVLYAGLGLSIAAAILERYSPLQYVRSAADRLSKLQYGRSCFSIGQKLSVEEAEKRVIENLEKNAMEKSTDCTATGAFRGVWQNRRRTFGEKSLEEWKARSFHFFLYTVEDLNTGEWERIRAELAERMAEIRRAERAREEKTDVVYAACVLADSVDGSVALELQKSQSFALSEDVKVYGVRVCAAVPARDEWYLCAELEREKASRSNRSRKLLGQAVFGGKFPYQGNDRHSRAYLDLLEEACELPLSENYHRMKEEKRAEKEKMQAPDPIFSQMQEGELRLEGDVLYCLDGRTQISELLYLPGDFEMMRREEEEDGEDFLDLEDLIASADDESEPEEEHVPAFGADYRGRIVLTVPTVSIEPRLRMLNRATRRRVAAKMVDYLLSIGFEKVSLWDSDKKSFVSLDEI